MAISALRMAAVKAVGSVSGMALATGRDRVHIAPAKPAPSALPLTNRATSDRISRKPPPANPFVDLLSGMETNIFGGLVHWRIG